MFCLGGHLINEEAKKTREQNFSLYSTDCLNVVSKKKLVLGSMALAVDNRMMSMAFLMAFFQFFLASISGPITFRDLQLKDIFGTKKQNRLKWKPDEKKQVSRKIIEARRSKNSKSAFGAIFEGVAKYLYFPLEVPFKLQCY